MSEPSQAPSTSKSAAELNGHPAEFTMPATRRVDFTSSVNGRRYSILVSLPNIPPPPAGYPVMYVLDGEFQFASWAEATRFGAGPQVMIVGLGYPPDPAWVKERLDHFGALPAWMSMFPPSNQLLAGMERWRDYTVGVNEEELAPLAGAFPMIRPSDTGGVDDFLKTIEADVKPLVYGLAPIDRNSQAIYGHSLGGQAITRALLTEPKAFRTFVIGSPNLIFGKAKLFAGWDAFARQVESGEASPRVLLAAGALEGKVPDAVPAGPVRDGYEEMLKDGPIAGGEALIRRLQALKGAPGYEVADPAFFEDMNHVTASWAALGRTLEFAFDPWVPEGVG